MNLGTEQQRRRLPADTNFDKTTAYMNVVSGKEGSEKVGSQRKNPLLSQKTNNQNPLAQNAANFQAGVNKPQKEAQKKSNFSVEKQKNPDQTKKPSTGGVLAKGGATGFTTNQKESIIVDTTLSFGLQDLIDCMSKGKQLGTKELQKIQKNYMMYIREQKQVCLIQSISSQVSIKGAQGNQHKIMILNFSYLNSLEDKQKTLLNQFWVSIIKQTCNKLKFLSLRGCLEIIKLHVGMNKDVYCQKGNAGNLNVKLFSNPEIFPIINNKVSINTQNAFYQKIVTEVETLTFKLFQGLNVIFKQMLFMKKNQREKYNFVFEKLQKDERQKKNETVTRLMKSLILLVKYTQDKGFQENISYVSCVVQSIWSAYSLMKQIFDAKKCRYMLQFLDDNYLFFNQFSSLKLKSEETNKFMTHVQRIIVNLLLNHPFTFMKWQKDISSLVFKSNLELLEPFKYVLTQNKRMQRGVPNYPLQGIHWKQLIDLVIQLNHQDLQAKQFVFDSMNSILRHNSNVFWKDPSQFQSFFIFSQKMIYSLNTKNIRHTQYRDVFFNQLRLASSLIGQTPECGSQPQNLEEISLRFGLEHPQNKRLPYALNVHNQFSRYFMQMDRNQFLAILGKQLDRQMSKSISPQLQQDDEGNERELYNQQILKEYLLKLLLSEPTLLFDIKKYVPHRQCEKILNYLITNTFQVTTFSLQIFDLSFTALDSLLTHPQTYGFIQNILNLSQGPGKSPSYFDKDIKSIFSKLFTNPDIIPYIARHCSVLVDRNYHKSQWNRLLLKHFSANCSQHHSRGLPFALSYATLLANIMSRLNSEDSVQIMKVEQLRPLINYAFIVQFIKDNLKFDYFKGSFVNASLSQQKRSKAQALIQSVRLFNVILLYHLRMKNLSGPQNQLNYLATGASKGLLTQERRFKERALFFSNYESKQLGINDDQFSTQVRSFSDHTTTYLNALSLILVNSTSAQKKLLKKVNLDYQKLIMESIEALFKINSKQDAKKMFEVYLPNNRNQILFSTQRSNNVGGCNPLTYMNKFISYIQHTLSQTGIQILIFGNLIQEQQRLRRLIDKIRTKIQNKFIRERVKPLLLLRLLATLSRYFRNTLNALSSRKRNISSASSLLQNPEIRDHLQFLLESILEYSCLYFTSRNKGEIRIVDNILANIYGGFLTLQTIDRSCFIKWIKKHHKVLLHKVNLGYLRDKQNAQQQGFKQKCIGEQFFKLIQLFLHCQEYLAASQFNVVVNVQNFCQSLENFVFYISKYTDYSKLSRQVTEILLEMLIASVGLFIQINKNKTNLAQVLKQLLDNIQSQKKAVTFSMNSTILQLIILNYLKLQYQTGNIQFQDDNRWPLQMNCICSDVSPGKIKLMIQSLKKETLHNLLFVSICNGLFFLIQNTEKIEWNKSQQISQLFNAYKLNIGHEGSLQNYGGLSKKSKRVQLNHSSPYRKIWILQLLLAILTNAQRNQINGNEILIEKQFQKVLMTDDTIMLRFGYFLRKMSLREGSSNIPWLGRSNEQLNSMDLTNKDEEVSYCDKLQLYQLMKITNFVFASHDWNSQYKQQYQELIQALISYRKIFEHLPFSNQKQRPSSLNQLYLQQMTLTNYFYQDKLKTNAQRHLERQRINGQVLKSSNFLELMHQIINIQLASQYAVLCVTIFSPFQPLHLPFLKKNVIFSNVSEWNTLLMQLSQSLTQKYILMVGKIEIIKPLLHQFTQNYYIASGSNMALSHEMLFTNSRTLSTSLNSSYESSIGSIIQTLNLLFDSIHLLNKKLQQQLRVQYKAQYQRFCNNLASLKKYDKDNFNYLLYDVNEQKKKVNQTIRSNMSRTINNVSGNHSVYQV